MKKDKKVVGLQYKNGMRAPIVTSKGAGKIADKILEIAKENNIPIYVDENLLNFLYTLDINEEIPEELYKIVAEVLAFVYNLDKKNYI